MPNFKVKELPIKAKLQYGAAFFMLVVGAFCVIASLFIPPHGVIDSSVLYFAGLSLAFVGSVFGIDIRWTGQIDKIKLELESEIEKRLREEKYNEAMRSENDV